MPKRYYPDDKVLDIHQEIQKDLQKKKKDPIKNIPTGSLFFIIAAALIALFLAMFRNTESTKLFFMVAVFIGILFLLGKRGLQPDVLTEQQCKSELYYLLKYKQKNPLGIYRELPDGEIRIDLKGRLRHFDGKPWKRYIGFSVITIDHLEEKYYAVQNPYTGDIIETNYCPEGFDPRTMKDIVQIAPPELMSERQWAEYGGKLR